MATGGKVATKKQTGIKVQLKKKGRDIESDKDYTVGEDHDFDESDSDCNDSDEEFRPDDVDGDEDLPAMKKKNRVNTLQKRKLKNSTRKKPISRRKNVCDEGSASGYTISEEEREQIREAKELCKSLTTDLRSSYLKTIKDEKTEQMEMKVGKQVCGICLSQEGKRTVRGMLSCCSHYFCFPCIMEWSKVESRCPLCKQRFETIRRAAQIIPVPECDQVYQPSVEELRGYADPYEDVICSECHQGWDDALMLLCDLCDSSAHTYCVGLGRQVPEGNWYCLLCRSTVLASSNASALSTPHSVGVVSERRRIQQQIHHLLISRSQQAGMSGTMSAVAPSVDHQQASTSTRPRGPRKELVQSMVRSHLKSLSRDSDLGYARFKYFARRCTHTILAAFGSEHRRHEVYRVQTPPLVCNHGGSKWEVAGQCSSCLDCFTGSVVREVVGKEE